MNPYLLLGLEAGPRIIQTLVNQIERHRHDEPTHENRFTPREVIAHLADWEPILLERMKIGVQSPGATVDGIDEGQRAIDQGYANKEVAVECDSFKTCRALTVAWLAERSPADWDKYIVHNERGNQTVRDLANTLLAHDVYHIDQLCEVVGDKVASTW